MIKKLVIVVLIVLSLINVSCTKNIPEDFNFSFEILGGWNHYYGISTFDNTYRHYDDQKDKDMKDELNLTENEKQVIYKDIKEIWSYLPTSFDVKEKLADSTTYKLSITMNNQSKEISWNSGATERNEIAAIITKKIYDIKNLIDENR